MSVNMQSYLECDVTGVEPIRELVSDSSYISSLTVVVTGESLKGNNPQKEFFSHYRHVVAKWLRAQTL